ncbi:MAG: 1,4-dihydroxy-2-naphthoyl-CoA hydrolase [Streptosporangiaceae bacterium]|nr:1,4-dihydroxy-2-naphthoyl-CoA hydrolase [Streptosporangiaceae bacterium]
MTSQGDVPGLIPFARTLGLSVVRNDPTEVQVRLDWDPDLCTSGGVLHGGVIMAAADTAGGICAFRNLPPGAAGTITVESKTNFLSAVTRGHIDAIAKPIHLGRTLIVIESDVRDDQQRLVARVIQSQLVLAQ